MKIGFDNKFRYNFFELEYRNDRPHSNSGEILNLKFENCDENSNIEEVQKSTKTERKPDKYAVSAQNNEAKEAVDQLVIRNEDNFECRSCGRTTKKSSDIRRHVEIHIEGLSFECQICGNTFRSRMNLNNHKNRNH